MNLLFLLWVFFFPGTEEYVKIIPPQKPVELRMEKEAQVEIYLVPAEGIHINGDPMPRFQIVTEKSPLEINVVKTPALEKGEPFSVLNSKSPFVLNVKMKEKVKTETKVDEKIKVIYFYCSDKEGWCSRGADEITLQFIIK